MKGDPDQSVSLGMLVCVWVVLFCPKCVPTLEFTGFVNVIVTESVLF